MHNLYQGLQQIQAIQQQIQHNPLHGIGGQLLSSRTPQPGQGIAPWLPMRSKLNLIKQIIFPNTTRIRELHLTLPNYYRNTVALMQQYAQFPLLEEISLNFPLPTSSPLAPFPHLGQLAPQQLQSPTYPLLENAPRLQKVKFASLLSHTQLQLPWSGITHFEVTLIPSAAFIQVLSRLKSLQHCKVTVSAMNYPHSMMNSSWGGGSNGAPPPAHIPTLHTLDITLHSMQPNLDSLFNADDIHFPNLKVLSINSEGWHTLATSLLKNTTSLSEFHISLRGQPSRDVVKEVLSLPAFSQLTHFSYRTTMQGSDAIEPTTIKAIALGQLLPNLHTFIFDGRMSPPTLANLIATKGFISTYDGSTIYPNVGKTQMMPGASASTNSHPTQTIAVPFQLVKMHGCHFDVVGDPDLNAIQNLVGLDCFKMETPEINWTSLMADQIGWDIDD